MAAAAITQRLAPVRRVIMSSIWYTVIGVPAGPSLPSSGRASHHYCRSRMFGEKVHAIHCTVADCGSNVCVQALAACGSLGAGFVHFFPRTP